MSSARVTVVFVAGWLRSGTTLLGNVLGQLDGAFAAGEVRFLWRRLAHADRTCGCGAEVRDCPIWSAVVQRAFGEVGRREAKRREELGESLLLNRRVAHLALARCGGSHARAVREYRALLACLYPAIADVTGSRLVIDTSKTPLYGMLLEGLPGIDVRVVHLVRDARATLFSSRRRGAVTSPALELLLWDAWNALVEGRWRGSGRYALIRYEDFAQRPRATLAPIAGLVDASDDELAFLDAPLVDLGRTHTVGGNENRFRPPPIRIAPDDEWRERLPRAPRLAATALTWPLLIRHGYLLQRPG